MDDDVKLRFNDVASNSPYLGAYVLELTNWIRDKPQLYSRLANRLDLLVNYVSKEETGSVKSRIVKDVVYINLLITHSELGNRSRDRRDFQPARVQEVVGNRLIAELIRRNQSLDRDSPQERIDETYFVALQAFNDNLDAPRSNWYSRHPSTRRRRK